MRWAFLTFGGGSSNYVAAAERLGREAGRSGWFTDVTVETPRSLISDHRPFWDRHRDFILSNPRLYGYAIWKPYLIGHHVARLPSGWGLCYLDAGCHLNVNKQSSEKFLEYSSIALDKGIWATQLDSARWGYDSFPECAWTKADLLDALDLSASDRISAQVQSGMMLFPAESRQRELIDQWSELSHARHYAYSDDSASSAANCPAFVEHRHDQSIFSCLTKVFGFTASSDETWFGPDWFTRGRAHPIWAARWRTGASMRPWQPRYLKRALLSRHDGEANAAWQPGA